MGFKGAVNLTRKAIDDLLDELVTDHLIVDSLGKTLNDLRQRLPGSGTIATTTSAVGSVASKTGFTPPVGNMKEAFLNQITPSSATDYNIINITSTSGYLVGIRWGAEDNGNVWHIQSQVEMKINIDGGGLQTFGHHSFQQFIMSAMEDTTTSANYRGVVMTPAYARFESSLRVTISKSAGTYTRLMGQVFYTEDV